MVGLLALIVVVVGLVLVLLHTDFGREQVRKRVEAQLNDVFVGDVKVGALSGSLLSDFSVLDVEILDHEGQPAVALARIDIGYRLFSLWDKTVFVDKLILTDLKVSARRDAAGIFNLTQLVASSKDDEDNEDNEDDEDDEDGPPSPWQVKAPRIELRNSAASYAQGAQPMVLRDITLEASFEFEKGEMTATIERLAAVYLRRRGFLRAELPSEKRELAVSASGLARISSQGVFVDAASITAGAAVIEVGSLALFADGRSSADATIKMPADVVRAFDPASKLLADINLDLTSRRPNPGLPIDFEVTGSVGKSPLEIEGNVTPEKGIAEVTVSAKSVDLSAVWRGLPPSLATVVVNAKSEGLALEELRSNVSATIAGRVDKATLGDLEIVASLKDGVASASLLPKTGPRWIDAKASYQIDGGVIKSASLAIEHPDIAKLASAYVDVGGDVDLSAKASGTVDALRIEGTLDSNSLSAFGNRTRSLSTEFEGVVGQGRYSGKLDASAASIFAADRALGSADVHIESERTNVFRVEASSRGPRKSHEIQFVGGVTLRGPRTTIDVGSVLLASRGLSWRGAGGSVELGTNNKIAVQGVSLKSRAGHVDIDGDFRVDGGLAGGEIDVRARNVDLADIGRALKLKDPIQGRASIRLFASKESRRKTNAKVDFSLVRAKFSPQLPFTDATVNLILDKRDLTLTANARADGIGAFTAAANGKAPRDPLSAAGYSRLKPDALVSATFGARNLELASIAHLGADLPKSGTASLDGTIGPGGRDVEVSLAARGVVSPRLDEPTDANVKLVVADRKVVVTGDAEVQKRGALTFNAVGDLPGSWLQPRTFAALSEKNLKGAEVELSGLELDWWNRRFALSEDLYEARANVKIVVAEAMSKADATINVEQPLGGVRSHLATNRVTATVAVTERTMEANLRANVAAAEVVTAKATLASGWRDIAVNGGAAVSASALVAELEVHKFPLIALQDASSPLDIRQSNPPQGTLTARVEAKGTLENPSVTLVANTNDAVLAGTEYLDFGLKASYLNKNIDATLSGNQKPGGSIVATVGLRGQSGVLDSRVVAKDWDLGFLKHIVPARSIDGFLTADFRAQGPLAEPSVVGTAKLREGSVRPGAPLYTLRDLNLEVALSETALVISGGGESGRGSLKLDGKVALAKLVPQNAVLDLDLSTLPVSAGPLSVLVDSKTKVTAKNARGQWTIDVAVGETIISVPGETTRSLHPDELPSDIVFVDAMSKRDEPAAPVLSSTSATTMVINIRAPESISVRGPQVRTTVDVDLKTTIGSKLVLEGNVATQGGWVELFGRRYDLRRGEVGFDGRVDPSLNVELVHEFSAMSLVVAIGGTGSAPELELRSDPASYDDSELLSFVLGASPDDDRSGEEAAGSRAAGVASSLLANKLQSVVRDIVPIDVLKVDLSDDSAAADKLTVGKWLTKKIFLAYRRRFDAERTENENEASIEYRFRRRWLLETFFGDQGAGGADVLWIRRF